MIWTPSYRTDDRVRPLADRHYNRQSVGAKNFAPPGRCIVLKAVVGGEVKAFWITSYPFKEYVRHAWAGAWVCSAFRNEGAGLSSELIVQAVSATRHIARNTTTWEGGVVPALGMITFVDTEKTRHKRDPGRCYLKAGFKRAKCPVHAERVEDCAACEGKSEGGLIALQLLPHEMPPPEPVDGMQLSINNFLAAV